MKDRPPATGGPRVRPPQAATENDAPSQADALTRPADAIIIVIASKGGTELGRWEGPMDYFFELPARFTATRTGAGWTWSDKLGAKPWNRRSSTR